MSEIEQVDLQALTMSVGDHGAGIRVAMGCASNADKFVASTALATIAGRLRQEARGEAPADRARS